MLSYTSHPDGKPADKEDRLDFVQQQTDRGDAFKPVRALLEYEYLSHVAWRMLSASQATMLETSRWSTRMRPVLKKFVWIATNCHL